MKRYVVTLTREEREELSTLTARGNHASRKVISALVLLNCDEGEYQKHRCTGEETAAVLRIGSRTVDRIKRRFVEGGLDAALERAPSRRVYTRKADGELEAHLIALSCSAPPAGFARWSLRLLADKAVELNYVDSISYETVRRVLKKTNSNRGAKRVG